MKPNIPNILFLLLMPILFLSYDSQKKAEQKDPPYPSNVAGYVFDETDRFNQVALESVY